MSFLSGQILRPVALLGLVLLGAACEPPPVVPTADRRQQPEAETSRVEGTVMVTGTTRGDVVLFLYDEARPPPPQGSGRPVSFTVLTREEVFGAAAAQAAGPFTAPFTFSLVPEGRYLVRGFIDVAGDFLPWYGVTAEPNAGDVGGAAVDAVTRQPWVAEVRRDGAGALQPATGLTVSLAPSAATVAIDRPSFEVAAPAGALALNTNGTPTLLTLRPLAMNEGAVRTQPGAFVLRIRDDNNDGVPDRVVNGVPEVWPRVIVRKLADSDPTGLTDENDLDRNGLLDDAGPAVVLAAGFVPDTLVAALRNPDTGEWRMGPVPLVTAQGPQALTLAVQPLALDARNPAQPVPLQGVPPGRYAIILMSFTGQTWRVPNELNPAVATPLALPARESQAFVLEVR